MMYLDGGSEDGTAEEHLQKAAERGEYTGEGPRVRSDGSTFWAGISLTALRDSDGNLLGFAKVARDLTAGHATEAALNRELRQLLHLPPEHCETRGAAASDRRHQRFE